MATETTFWVQTDGADTNGGTNGTATSGSASAVVTGTCNTSSGSGNITLIGSPTLTAVLNNVDCIRIAGATGGLGSSGDVFQLTVKGDPTLVVTPVVGNAQSGVAFAIGGAFQTIQRALNCVDDTGGGWEVQVKTGTYAGAGTRIDLAKQGTKTNPNLLSAYISSKGDIKKDDYFDDAKRAVADQTSGSGTVLTLNGSLGSKAFWIVEHLKVNSGDGIGIAVTIGRMVFRNVKSANNGSIGWDVNTGPTTYDCCEADNNGTVGVDAVAVFFAYNFRSYLNDSYGMTMDSYTALYKCLFYGNATIQLECDGVGTEGVLLARTTIDGETNTICVDGPDEEGRGIVVDNYFYDGSEGLGCNDEPGGKTYAVWSNVFASNTADRVNWQTGEDDVSTAGEALFVDAANRNYELQAGALGIGIGYGGSDAGYESRPALPRRPVLLG